MQYRCNSPRPKLDVAKNLCIMTYMHYDDMRYENVDCTYRFHFCGVLSLSGWWLRKYCDTT
jgi:hypothetical protein